MSVKKDLYAILGIEPSAEEEDIKRAYRKLASKYHPDRLPLDASTEQKKRMSDMFELITEAKELLLDPARRLRYDQFGIFDQNNAVHAKDNNGRAAGGGNAANAAFYMDYSNGNDIFNLFLNSMFGSRMGQQQQQNENGDANLGEEDDKNYGFDSGVHDARRTKNHVVPLHVDLQELYRGTTRKYSYTRRIVCPSCRGTGALSPGHLHFCRACKGSGQRMMRKTLPRGVIQQFTTLCSDCDGRGQIITQRCKTCNGRKMVQQSKAIHVRIRPGMDDGHHIVLKQQGDEWPGRVTGDLVFQVQQNPHPILTRKGHDLHMTKTITLLEALTGFTMLVETLNDNRWLRLQVDEIIQPGVCKVILNEGMPISRGLGSTEGFEHDLSQFRRGRLVVEFQVQFPHHLNMEMKHYLRLFLDPEMYQRMMRNDQTLPLLVELKHYAQHHPKADQSSSKDQTTKQEQQRPRHITIVDSKFAPGTFDISTQKFVPTTSSHDYQQQQVEKERKKSILSSMCATQ